MIVAIATFRHNTDLLDNIVPELPPPPPVYFEAAEGAVGYREEMV